METTNSSNEVKGKNGTVLQMVNVDYYHRNFLDVPHTDS